MQKLLRDKPPRHRACFRIRSLKGSPGRAVLPSGANLYRSVARHTPTLGMKNCTAFCPGRRMGRSFGRAKAGGNMAEGLRPPEEPPPAAIGRLPSRMPVIIRSHEGSACIMGQERRAWMEIGALFDQSVDIERHYSFKRRNPSPDWRLCRRQRFTPHHCPPLRHALRARHLSPNKMLGERTEPRRLLSSPPSLRWGRGSAGRAKP